MPRLSGDKSISSSTAMHLRLRGREKKGRGKRGRGRGGERGGVKGERGEREGGRGGERKSYTIVMQSYMYMWTVVFVFLTLDCSRSESVFSTSSERWSDKCRWVIPVCVVGEWGVGSGENITDSSSNF